MVAGRRDATRAAKRSLRGRCGAALMSLGAVLALVATGAGGLAPEVRRPPATMVVGRRRALSSGLGVAASVLGARGAFGASLSKGTGGATTRPEAGRFFLESILPPVPFKRATYRYDLGRETWAFEQLLKFSNVSATVRMTVVRLADGGLWVCAPVAPTGECLSLLKDLGPVRHLVLPVTALETLGGLVGGAGSLLRRPTRKLSEKSEKSEKSERSSRQGGGFSFRRWGSKSLPHVAPAPVASHPRDSSVLPSDPTPVMSTLEAAPAEAANLDEVEPPTPRTKVRFGEGEPEREGASHEL